MQCCFRQKMADGDIKFNMIDAKYRSWGVYLRWTCSVFWNFWSLKLIASIMINNQKVFNKVKSHSRKVPNRYQGKTGRALASYSTNHEYGICTKCKNSLRMFLLVCKLNTESIPKSRSGHTKRYISQYLTTKQEVKYMVPITTFAYVISYI